jgi:hypothetical protein
MVLLLLCGCTQQPDMEQIAVAEDFTAPATDKVTYAEPPLTIRVESEEDVKSIFYAVNLSEDDFLAYLDKNDYRAAVYSKEEALDLKEKLSAVPIPILSNAKLIDCTLTPDYENLHITYMLPSDNDSSGQRSVEFILYYGEENVDEGWTRRPQSKPIFSAFASNKTTSQLKFRGWLQGHPIICRYWDVPGKPTDFSPEELSNIETYVQAVLNERMTVIPLVWYVERAISEVQMRTLQFNSLEELGNFYQSTELDDAEFQDYISDFNWIHSKEDVDRLKHQLSRAPFPLLSNAVLTEISFQIDIDKLHLVYALDSDEGHYLDFDVYYGYRNIHKNYKKYKPLEFISTGEHKTTGFLTAKTMYDGHEIKYIYRPSQTFTNAELLRNKPVLDKMLQENLSIEGALYAPRAVLPQ